MSEPKLISPLLDGFVMGNPISDHDGVRCCPAMKENSDNKYIVKIISIPASQVQLDALLLTGAYKDPADAMDYFKAVADGVEAEAQLLKKLSKLEGFLSYDSWQVEPMDENRLGYDIYLISSYKRSLEKYMRRNTMTHLGTVNLGLDICAALAIARRAGHIYVDLKPGNIFLSENREYRIGDLGFLEMASLKYASMPKKYVNAYTAPELRNDLNTVNTTADTYALGMILYQIYNNGQLPEVDPESDEPLPAPANADYEMADIILQACAPKVADRFKDPTEMGQELVAYMKRNRVNNTPITPPAAAPVAEETAPILDKNGAVFDETAPNEEDAADAALETISEETNTMLDQADLLISDTPLEEPAPAEEAPAEEAKAEAEESPEETESESQPETEQGPSSEETPESEEEAPAVSEDSFIADTEEEMDFAAFLAMGDEPEEAPAEAPAEEKTKQEKKKKKKKKKKKSKKKNKKKKSRGGLIFLVVLLLLSLLGAGGYYYYDNYYLQTIHSISVDGQGDEMTVKLDTEVDNSLLQVIITDTYGNTKTSDVSDNQAAFTELLPDMLYKIRVEISGFHALHPKGVASHGYTTEGQTKIVSFSAKTGAEDGSVVLNFAVEGPTSENWIVSYSADEEAEQIQEFSGHMVTINGLTVGKTYTFHLMPVDELMLVGESSVEFTAARIVMAENLAITDYAGGSLSVQWNSPADTEVSGWTVRCYSADGFDQTLTTGETTATFTGLDSSKPYTLEVTAAGMTHPARLSITQNPYNVSNIQVNDTDETRLILTWDNEGDAPADGWVLKYSVDGTAHKDTVKCDGNSAVVQPRIPGASYVFSVESSDGNSVFGGTYSYDCPNAKIYKDEDMLITENVINSKLSINMLVTPEDSNWSYKTHGKNAFTSTFQSGQKASLLLHISSDFYTREQDTTILYVIRNESGDVLMDYVSQETMDWQLMWSGDDYRYCELNIPSIPTEPGKYSLYLYFNNGAIAIVDFSVTA